jgi:hypothetical protein
VSAPRRGSRSITHLQFRENLERKGGGVRRRLLLAPGRVGIGFAFEKIGEAMRSKWTDVWIPEEDAYFNRQRPDKKADLVIDGSKPYEI